ncbi:MAG: hypothetical protein RIB71_02480 [Imperialibacter sp.]|uniref:hypothetical protein n=1 Tax=Imperialibacter sp. TaxID=2038411 RepID=UPI0032F07992
MKTIFSIAVILFFCYSCGCKSECTSPPTTFTLEIVDLETGANLIENGTISTADIKLKATDTGQEVAFLIADNQIVSDEIGWRSADGSTEFELKLGDAGTVICTIVYRAVSENCCSFFELQGASFSKEHEMIDEYSYLIKL